MPDMRISEDTVLLIARLANEAEDMKDAANEALKSAWSDYRESLKSLKLTGKEISAEVGQLKAAIAEVRLTETDRDKRENKAEGIDGYVAILSAPRARARKGTKVTTENTSNYRDEDEEVEPEVTTPPTTLAALRADPAMAVVSAVDLKPITQPQPAPQAGRDLTTSHALDNGQVAPNPVAKAADDANSGDATSEVSAVADAPEQAEVASRVAGDRAPAATSEVMDATAGETAPQSMYAEPGVVVWESAPPEGVARHPYSNLFGTYGQDIAVIEGDLEAANAAPIVKIGNVILDGWARYTLARSMFTEVLEDGVTKRIPLEYPVVQYDGTDPLIDCIKWNMDGRLMTSEQKFRVAQALSRMEPKRKGDIYAAFELGMELVA